MKLYSTLYKYFAIFLLNASFFQSFAYSNTAKVIEILDESIALQQQIQKNDPKKAVTFLPIPDHWKPTYKKEFWELQQELKTLQNTDTHSDFFVQYARRLLRAVTLFATYENWQNQNPGQSITYFDVQFLRFSGKSLRGQAILNLIGASADPEFKKLKEKSASEMTQQFDEELHEAEVHRKASYRWFILYSSRLIFLAEEKTRFFNSANFNTGFYQFSSFITAEQLWRSPQLFQKFLELAPDFFTSQMSTPLALVRLFPHILMLPYPFELSEEDLIETHPFQSETVFPVGFPFLDLEADGARMSSAPFFFHDVQHLAALTASYLTVSANRLLEAQEANSTVSYLKRGQELFSRVIHQLKEAIAQLEDTKTKKLYTLLLFKTVHEDTVSLHHRINYLLHPEVRPEIARYLLDELYSLLGSHSKEHQENSLRLLEKEFKEFARNKSKIGPWVLLESWLKKEVPQTLAPVAFHARMFHPMTLNYEFNRTPRASHPNVQEITDRYSYFFAGVPELTETYFYFFPAPGQFEVQKLINPQPGVPITREQNYSDYNSYGFGE